MSRIYTGSGDRGMTGIHGGERVSKTDIRIEANGALDELNVAVGMVRTELPGDHVWQRALRGIQLELMTLMSLVATPAARRAGNPNRLTEGLVGETERLIDSVMAECSPADSFILPGGSRTVSLLHQARVTARRAERRLWSLDEVDEVPDEILVYLNRLSDLFFVMARHESQHSGCAEEIWRKFGYKRKAR